MAYIGSQAPTGFSTSAKDSFSGDNSTVAFTMSRGQSTGNDVQVFVDNVRQEPVIAYNVSGATLTFTEAPPTGTNNIYCIHNSNQAVSVLPPADLGARDYVFGDDVSLKSDGAILNFGTDSDIKLVHVHNTGLSLNTDGHALLFGADSEVSLTHVADTGLLLNSTSKLMFGDSASFIQQSSDGVLKLDGEATVEIASTSGVKLTGTTPTLTIGDAGAEDTKIVFDGNAQDFHIGLDDSADDLVIGLGSALGTTTHMSFDENGHVLKPLQSAFLAEKTDADQANLAAGSNTTITFNNEVFDVNGDFADPKFTAPVTGKYLLTAKVRVDDTDTDANFYSMDIVTSNRDYADIYRFESASDNDYFTFAFSVIADMDANDTAVIRIGQNGGASQSDASNDGDRTQFGGYLLG